MTGGPECLADFDECRLLSTNGTDNDEVVGGDAIW